ncbi:MAG: hypothetical protein NTV54_10205 [Ignavibacteriales bacterium]|nr:hypothetical protein [Ignavibacteriales bacterium]
MAPTRYKIYNGEVPHFLTMTVVEWIPLFINPEIVSMVLESLRFVQKDRKMVVYAYVIMEHHLHLIASAPDLTRTIRQFKSFTARSIVDYLRGRGAAPTLERLQHAKLRHKSESDYQVWQEGSHPEEIHSEEMLLQKIEYIHNNPVRRGYVDLPREWRYSSARNFEGKEGLLEIRTDWRSGM